MVPSSKHLSLYSARRGLTLIEVMVSLAAAMVVLAAVISVLGMVTKGVADSRSMIEVTNRLRSAQVLLRNDLAGATNPGLVMQKGEMGNGYLEVIEGTSTYDYNGDINIISGDIDDIIMLTTRNNSSPFVGKCVPTASNPSGTVTSNIAEVVWFLVYDRDYDNGATKVYNLHRRAFLICNNIPKIGEHITQPATDPQYDISSRNNGSGNIPCSLGDLANRRNRVFHNHNQNSYPYQLNTTAANMRLVNTRQGEDIVLTNVLAFDIKVFDPTANNDASGNSGLVPGDRDYKSTGSSGKGAYVDLGKGAGSRFGASTMDTKSKMSGNPTYDTWTYDYENDGLDTDGVNGIDTYVNGLDDKINGIENGVVDDPDERETMPPYPYALRGVQIKIRVYEPSSKQVREVTVEETFVP